HGYDKTAGWNPTQGRVTLDEMIFEDRGKAATERGAAHRPRSEMRQTGGAYAPKALQREAEETRVERKARWRIRVVEQQRVRRGARHDELAQCGCEKECLFGGLVLEQFHFRRNGQVFGAKLLTVGRSIVIVVMARAARNVVGVDKFANNSAGVDRAGEKRKKPAP
ncbi:MAG: hypothetical protein ABI831_08130, partial [Betaproteobacteria bacterium]